MLNTHVQCFNIIAFYPKCYHMIYIDMTFLCFYTDWMHDLY